jgi:hypothetical protein
VDYRPPDGAAGRMSPAGITFYWINESGLVFAFTGNARQSRQRMACDDAALVANFPDREPARWDNIATRRIDSLAVQYVRFRAGANSTELFVATRATLERLSEVRQARPDWRGWSVPYVLGARRVLAMAAAPTATPAAPAAAPAAADLPSGYPLPPAPAPDAAR